jgi:PPOX class probable F420-dependent enzyme
MDVEEARRFIRSNHRAVLVTRRHDDGLQLSPVVVAMDGDGLAVISATEDRAKTRNLRRDPRAALCVMTDRFWGGAVQVEGVAQIVPLPEAMDGLVAYYRAISGEHPDWDDYRRAMEAEGRCLIRVSIERATG